MMAYLYLAHLRYQPAGEVAKPSTLYQASQKSRLSLQQVMLTSLYQTWQKVTPVQQWLPGQSRIPWSWPRPQTGRWKGDLIGSTSGQGGARVSYKCSELWWGGEDLWPDKTTGVNLTSTLSTLRVNTVVCFLYEVFGVTTLG